MFCRLYQETPTVEICVEAFILKWKIRKKEWSSDTKLCSHELNEHLICSSGEGFTFQGFWGE